MKEYGSIFKNKNFIYLWTSQILSQLTINIMNFLLLIRLFSVTESTIATSMLWVAYSLPAIFIGPFASAAVDMMDRKKVLVFSNLFQALVVFAYALIFRYQIFLVYGVALIYSVLNMFYVPAESSSLPSVTDKKALAQANSLFFLTQQSALVLGFGFAGIINNLLGFERALFLCAGLLFLAFLSTTFLPKIKFGDGIPHKFEEAVFKFFSSIKDGYMFIRSNRRVLIPYLLLLSFQISLAIVMVNIPSLAKDVFAIDVNSAGLMIIVPAGIGAAMSAFYVPILLKKGLRKKVIIENGLMTVTLTILIINFLIPWLWGPWRLVISLVSLVALGIGFVGIVIPAQTYLQENTPGGYRGRIYGNFWFLVTIATMLPVVFSGAVTELFGIKFLFFILGALSFSALWLSKKRGDSLLTNNYGDKI